MRLGVNIPKMIYIPAGRFKIIRNPDKRLPTKDLEISAFAVGKYKVTNEEYRLYLEAIGKNVPETMADPGKVRYPVTEVSWFEAVAYCEWLSGITGRNFRLPTEVEWWYVYQGSENRKFPWGNQWDASRGSYGTADVMPVDAFPEGATPHGVMDLYGSVLEWAANWYGKYDPKEVKDPKGPEKGTEKALLGASWCEDEDMGVPHGPVTLHWPPHFRFNIISFRVAEDL